MGRHLAIAIIRLQNFNPTWWWISSARQSHPVLVWQYIFSLALCFKHLQFISIYQSRMPKSASTEDYGSTVRSRKSTQVLVNWSEGWHTYYGHQLWPHRSGTASGPKQTNSLYTIQSLQYHPNKALNSYHDTSSWVTRQPPAVVLCGYNVREWQQFALKLPKSHLLYKASDRFAWDKFHLLCSTKVLLETVMLWNFPPSFSHQSARDSNTHSKAYVTCYFNTTGNTTAQLQAFGL
jgi:hypothetical protein